MWQLAVVRDSKGVVGGSMEVEEELQVFTGMKSNPLFYNLQNPRIMFCALKDEVNSICPRGIYPIGDGLITIQKWLKYVISFHPDTIKLFGWIGICGLPFHMRTEELFL